MYYIYIHKNKINNNIFYVGKGKGRRAWVKYGRNSYWNNIVNKYGYIVEILKNNLSEEEAFVLEKDYIKKLKPLCNFTKGGEGISGFKFSDKSLKKKSKSALGNKNKLGKTSIGSGKHFKKGLISPFLGKTHTKYSKNKISQSKIGKKQSIKHKEKLAKIKFKPIIQYDLNMNKIQEWPSIKYASFQLKKQSGNISACCRGEQNTAFGSVWKFKNFIDAIN